jgi:hypothetical protein
MGGHGLKEVANGVCQCAGKPLRVKAAAKGGLPMQRIDIACPWHAAPGHHFFCRILKQAFLPELIS